MTAQEHAFKLDSEQQFEIVSSSLKFEELLITNNLFVDYFNEFLLNPSLSEKVKYNFVTGDLELIEPNNDYEKENVRTNNIDGVQDTTSTSPYNTHVVRLKSGRLSQLPQLTSTAEGVKKSLQSQLKAILKNKESAESTSALAITPSQQRPFSTNSYIRGNELALSKSRKIPDVFAAESTATNMIIREKSVISKDVVNQIDNHSFKDIDLVPITSWIEPKDLKDPKAALDSKIPVIKNRYLVNVIKKPFSIKWLKNRRLSIFLQSEFYNEFKLAMIFAQFGLFNNDLSKKDDKKIKKKITYLQVKLDEELIEMKLNPFNAKSDMEKLHENTKTDDFEVEKNTESGEIKLEPLSYYDLDEDRNQNRKKNILIENGQEYYQSIKENFKTSLTTNREEIDIDIQNSNEIEDEYKNPIVIDSVKEMAKILVSSIMQSAIHDVKSVSNTGEIKSETDIQDKGEKKKNSDKIKNFRYTINNLINKGNETSLIDKFFKQEDSNQMEGSLNDFNFNKSNSRLSYYKDYQTDNDLESKQSKFDESGQIANKYVIEFQDEPAELNYYDMFEEVQMRKTEIESFKNFLKDNDAFLFYKLWVDIDKIESFLDKVERQSYVKKLKLNYNQPSILNRINGENLVSDVTNSSSLKKNKYLNLYSNYEKNSDFWSFDYLKNHLQKKVLNVLINYWWPKYCIRMNSFQDYVNKKYPSYYVQKNIINGGKKSKIDLDVENIEKSIFYRYNKNDSKNNTDVFKNASEGNFSKISSKSEPKKSNKQKVNTELTSLNVTKKFVTVDTFDLPPAEPTKKSGIVLDNFQISSNIKTSLPIGWKRPISKATQMVQIMLDNRDFGASGDKNKSNREKEIYLEAIYREDIGGQIFMKYLSNKNKLFATNRLKCLQDLIKYKDLFYDEHFNQEVAKKCALSIYSKYIAVSAFNSIDCSKLERLKIHHLFSEKNPPTDNMNESSVFKPVYEDTFDSIEEFLLLSLFEEWKSFLETEKGYFRHNEIESIERSINIRSKELDDLLDRDQVRMLDKYKERKMNFRNSRRMSIDNDYSINQTRSIMNSQTNISVNSFTDLGDLISNSKDYEMFRKFLDTQNALNDLDCWIDIEAFSQIEATDQEAIDNAARLLRKKYLNKKYLFSKNGPIDEETQNIILEKIGGWNTLLEDIPPTLLIILAKKHLEKKLKNYWIPAYQNSEFNSKSSYKTQMMDVVDDVLYLKNKQPFSKEVMKLKKRRWLYSSQMIINFGKALRNNFTVKLFNKFLSLKSSSNDVREFDFNTNNLVNDLHFLIQVLEYKELCQKTPTDDQAKLAKVKHITNFFIDHKIPPKLRVDISPDVANRINEQKDFISPYLFLEANLNIFDFLMPYWIEFNKIRSGKDLDLFNDFSSFKTNKDFRPKSAKRSTSTVNDDLNSDDQSIKWRYNQYIKALKTQLVI